MAEALHRFEPPWIEVGRIYRRICFLRSEGLLGEARTIEETELAAAAARARGNSSSDSDADSLLTTLLREEEERVLEAIAFAEVLAPMLVRGISGLAPARPRAVAAPSPRTPRPGDGETREIADFIDEMLAQDRVGPR
jgi:hypothetical protein